MHVDYDVILIDYREPSDIIDAIRAREDVKVCALHTGDYITPQGAIERKTITDFLHSLANRRIFQQTARLSERYNPAYIIIEGLMDWTALNNPAWACAAMQRLTLHQSTPILFSSSKQDTIRLILKMCRPISRINSPDADVILIERRARSLARQQEALIMALPGIGARRAGRILRMFGNPVEFFSAQPKEWKKAGIGAVTKRRVREVIETTYEPR